MSQRTLTEIWIYPIKSLGGIRLDKAKVLAKGLQYDRRWMLIDNQGVFLTQRIYPQMALFKPAIQGNLINITFEQGQKKINPSTTFNLYDVSGKSSRARIWDDEVEVREVDPQVSQWFSRHLDIACKLVSFPEENPRPVDPQYKVNDEQVSLADAYPFLIIGQSSLDDLNARLADPIPMNRFRPNFVFTGGEPYEEDDWKGLSIGKNRFVAVKKCSRCTIPTVNQDTGEKGQEPLRTLAGYRNFDHNIFFGQNLVALNDGEVMVGDTLILSNNT